MDLGLSFLRVTTPQWLQGLQRCFGWARKCIQLVGDELRLPVLQSIATPQSSTED